MTSRVVVFVDYQNLYHGARDTFGPLDRSAPPTFGHVSPRKLGRVLVEMGKQRFPDRSFEQVRIYRGEPTKKSHPTLQAAFQRQVAWWDRLPQVEVIRRPLRYNPTRWENGRPVAWDKGQEKGIDVLIALDMALGAVRDQFDVAILVSGDTDLVPAVDAVLDAGKWVENAVWWPDAGHGRPLRSSADRRIWVHRMTRRIYDTVKDETNWADARLPSNRE